MSLLMSHSKIKFLFDENVDHRLLKFLKRQNVDIILKSKGLANGELADFSISEKRVFVTNDEDFLDSKIYSRSKIFSVVWLRIQQNEIESAKSSFSKLLEELKEVKDFECNLIILYKDKFEISPLC